ncbi:GroES-like protein [Xylariaceae sp. FL0255]|nr:GroES-like protein [Xylariaceae sp. FL0255]
MSQERSHDALVTVAARAPYEVRKFLTVSPKGDEIMINVKWTASTPLDLHQADGGLLVEHPMRTGSTSAGVVVEVGPDVKHLKVGDEVFGFAHQKPEWKAHQENATAPEWVFGKVPKGFTLEQAVTIPENLVTAFNTISADLHLPTPWPKPDGYKPPRANDRILIWGAASSVGQLTIQTLKYYGYEHIVGTASPRHHGYLKQKIGATEVYDYRDPKVIDELLASARRNGQKGGEEPAYPLIVDCIGSQAGSLTPLSKVAQKDGVVAVMLPVILTYSTDDTVPQYSMDAGASVEWAPGVRVAGVRTHFYAKNEMFKEKLQSEIMPALLAQGVVQPNRYQIIEGDTLLERATKALNAMREGVSGEKRIWRVSNA